MEQKGHYRHELKYNISYWQYLQIRSRLRQVMQMDPHTGKDGTYRIRSIYFDNLQDKALREKVDGVAKREKFRIRYYNDHFEQITLEKKIKDNNLCMKVSCPLEETQCRRLLLGDMEWMRQHPDSLVQELYGKMKYQQLKPRVLVSYTREPYIYAPGNVRITFDWNVRTTMYHQRFLEEKVYDIEAGDYPGEMIMEVKFDGFLPGVIQDLIQSEGIRPKGNTSLSSIASDPDTDRYSFKLEFDHYIEGQTCYGLDKLILNNNYADATNMKEAVVYDMYQYLGVDASFYNYAKICVNGEYWGVYLALEAVEDSFLLRNYGTEDGNLYKPESMGVGGEAQDGESGPQMGDKPDGESGPQMGGQPGNGNFPQMGEIPQDGDFPQMPDQAEGGQPSAMGENGGADLNYTDDDLDSYSTIWDGEISDTGKKDHKRVVEALKNISEGNDLETYMDVDNILKYMAVHTFVVNDDSLSGTMAHNYYLYEYNGRLNILPWDYNLSFGGMTQGGNMGGMSLGATSVINDAIDTPFSITDFFDALLENEEYLAKYHEYLGMLVDKYVNGGEFENTCTRIRSQIDELVKEDPTAFYTYEEYDEAVEMLEKVVKLRAKSVEGQLDGTIPSTDSGQQEDNSSLIDGSDLDLSVMGSFQH